MTTSSLRGRAGHVGTNRDNQKRPHGGVKQALAALVALALSGCAAVVTRESFDGVQSLVRARGETQELSWDRGPSADPPVERPTHVGPRQELGVEQAVQLALVRNPSLQAEYEELGYAQADLVQAGLLKNPTLAFSGLAAVGAAASPAYDLDFTKNLLDLLLRPARQRIAGAQLEATELRVAGEVVSLAAQVRTAYYTIQGAEQLVALLREIVLGSEASAELAARLEEAGNVSALRLAEERALLEQARADLMRAEAETIEPRENLTRLMGLSDEEATQWTIAPALPGLPQSDPPVASAIASARENRLELAAARKEQVALREALESARFWRYLGDLDVGAAAHKEQAERYWVVGPVLSLQLPIFDQKQAELAQLESRLRQSEARTSSLELDVASAVRVAHERLRASRRLADQYRERLIPLRRQAVVLSQQFYNFMLQGAFELIAAKQAEITSYRDYVAAVRDYWIAWANLERAVGTRLLGDSPPPDAAAAPLPSANSAGAPDHSAHGGMSHAGMNHSSREPATGEPGRVLAAPSARGRTPQPEMPAMGGMDHHHGGN